MVLLITSMIKYGKIFGNCPEVMYSIWKLFNIYDRQVLSLCKFHL
jgi:hypothetical protein